MVFGGFRLDLLFEMTQLARSTYYYQLKQLETGDKDKKLKEEIQSIYDEHKGNYGYRRIHLELRNRGVLVNHKKAENLIQRQFEGAVPYEKCYTDVTEFSLPNSDGKRDLSPVLDGYNSEIIDFTLSRSPDLKQIKSMLEKAFPAEK